MESIDLQVTILCILWFSVSLKWIHLSRLHTFPMPCNVISCFSRPNQRLQQPLKIDHWRFDGAQCAEGPGEIGRLPWIWRTVRKSAQSWYSLDIIRLKPAWLLWCFCPSRTWKAHPLLYRSLIPFKFFEW